MKSKKDNWYIDKSIQQAQYMNKLNEAWIPCQVKDLCRYIASKATWNHTKANVKSYQPTYVTQDTIEIQMNRSRNYVTAAKKKALELGWIQVLSRRGTSDLIWPTIGVDDPRIQPRVRREVWGREGLEPLEG